MTGFFPHHFNTTEHQDSIGPIPSEEDFGVKNMTSDTYNKAYKPWYNSVRDTIWSFKDEIAKYCEADVVLLAKAVVKSRKLFKE